MLNTLAVANYRSINKLVIPLGRLNLITGPNGSGKSNLYRALRLLAETAQGGVVNALAREGGLDSTFWAGPETISRRMRNGEVPIQSTVRQGVKRLRLGFAGEDFSYSISLGLPDSNGHFMLPEHSRPHSLALQPRPADQARMHLGRPALSARQPVGGPRRSDDPRTRRAQMGCAGTAHAEL
jgi:predicted ATPase